MESQTTPIEHNKGTLMSNNKNTIKKTLMSKKGQRGINRVHQVGVNKHQPSAIKGIDKHQ
jgi:hypothetical protein